MIKIFDSSHFPSKMALTVIENLQNIVDNEKINILDIGCGDGRDVLYLAQNLRNRRIVAIDPSQEKIQKARVTLSGENDIELQSIGFKELSENEQFDVILISNVYHFFNKTERELFREKVKRLLKLQGWFFLSTLSSNDKQYYGVGMPVPNDPNSFNGITYLHFASKAEIMKEFSFLKVIDLQEYYQKNYPADTEYHTMWMLVCRCC
ncbi:MAG: class I SAM-dependent methyltransferase [Promethearchaeota archaeon]